MLTVGGTSEGSEQSEGYGAFKDPLAWPGFATVDDLRGLPPVRVVVNELDPYRDEGVVFYRKCCEAGINSHCITVLGTPHCGDLNVAVVPDLAIASYRACAAFAVHPGDAQLCAL